MWYSTVLTMPVQELVRTVEYQLETASAPPPGVASAAAPSTAVAVAREDGAKSDIYRRTYCIPIVNIYISFGMQLLFVIYYHNPFL